MSLSDWLDVLQGISVVIAALVGAFGINTWKRQHTGKRRVELAEEVLALFYEAHDAIRDVRAPFSFGGEGTTRPKGENESPQRKEALDRAYVTVERLKGHQDLFAKLFSARYRFMAAFGKNSGQPFYDLNRLLNELRNTAWAYGENLMFPPGALVTEEQLTEHGAEARRLRRVLFNIGGEKDEFDLKVVAIIETIDQACREIIESHGQKTPSMVTKQTAKD